MSEKGNPLSIIVVGASGDLAKKKIVPALFALYCQGLLPDDFHVYGFARTKMSDDEFRSRIEKRLTCRYVPGEKCAERMSEFLARCSYMSGQYGDPACFRALADEMASTESESGANRVFYLAIPPDLFLDVAESLHAAGMVGDAFSEPWARVVIEKPFGKDRESSDALMADLRRVFSEDQTYRIDHYLGKEVIQNLMVLRFANLVFEPIWNRLYIDRIQISWRETIGVEGRGGYFDRYGIIRDVMQNHLLQILALVAMEQPLSMGQAVRDEKVKVLRSVEPARLHEMVLGQYGEGEIDGKKHTAYCQEDKVPSDSNIPTYAAAVLHVRNHRWEGVPFFLRAGKGMSQSGAEIYVQFKGVPGNIFCPARSDCLEHNEMLIRIQPDEGIFLRVMSKIPGMEMELTSSQLDLLYSEAFEGIIPDAYESLILDVIDGDRSLFIRDDELQASWDIFTPVLHEIDEKSVEPESYPFGTEGPESAVKLAKRYGATWR